MDNPREQPLDPGELDEALADSFPASDPPSVTSPTSSVNIDDKMLEKRQSPARNALGGRGCAEPPCGGGD
jgi:hypothetical protein